jgi:hypothetical protein
MKGRASRARLRTDDSSSEAAAYPWYGRWASTLVDNGYSLVTVLPGTKKPRHPRWHGACFKPTNDNYLAQHVKKFPGDSIGIGCGERVVAVDIDAADVELAYWLQLCAFEIMGPTSLIRVGQWPHRAFLYRPDGLINTKHAASVDILGRGSFLTAYGQHPGTKASYYWLDASPADTDVQDLPPVTPAQTVAFVEMVSRRAGKPFACPPMAANDNGRGAMPLVGPAATTLQGRIERDDAGVVVDGREAHMTLLAYREYSRGFNNPQELADRIWERFAVTADLIRLKSDGRKRWSRRDALSKAKEVIRKKPAATRKGAGREKHPVSHLHACRRPGYWDLRAKAEHQAEATRRVTAPSVLMVNQAMLKALQLTSGQVLATVEQLSVVTGLSKSTVKLARRLLTEAGLWITERGVYIPAPISLPRYTEGSEAEGTMAVRVQEEEDPLYRSSIPSGVSPLARWHAGTLDVGLAVPLSPEGSDDVACAPNPSIARGSEPLAKGCDQYRARACGRSPRRMTSNERIIRGNEACVREMRERDGLSRGGVVALWVEGVAAQARAAYRW